MKNILIIFLLGLLGVGFAQTQLDNTHTVVKLVATATQSIIIFKQNPNIFYSSQQTADVVKVEMQGLEQQQLNTYERTLGIQTKDKKTVVYVLDGKHLKYRTTLNQTYTDEYGFRLAAYSNALGGGVYSTGNTYGTNGGKQYDTGTHCSSSIGDSESSLTCTTDGQVSLKVTCMLDSSNNVKCDSQTH